MNDKEFNREKLEFHLPNEFRGLSKEYILDNIFNESIQSEWVPKVGDIMVGCTGNIFVISSISELHDSLGGRMYFFGGGLCNRDGGNVMDSTYCFSANENGKYYNPINGEQENPFHSSIRDFRYVPYPHERRLFKINVGELPEDTDVEKVIAEFKKNPMEISTYKEPTIQTIHSVSDVFNWLEEMDYLSDDKNILMDEFFKNNS